MAKTINQMLQRSKVDIFRKFSVKRRLDDGTGNFETTWQDLSAEVIKWGNIKWQTDEKKYNFFTQRGMSIVVKNDEGLFNDEGHYTSFWRNYLTRYRTLVKVEAGFLDPDDDSEISEILLYGYITEKIRTGDNNRVTLNIKSLYSILDEFPANKIITNSATSAGQLTASDLIGKIRDMTDGSGGFPIQKFFSVGAWNIEATANTLTSLNTTTMLDDLTCWGLAKKLAEAENKIVYVDRTGTFQFISRTEGALAFSFIGYPFQDATYGHTIKNLKNYQQDIDLLFNRVRVKHEKADTSTSYVTKEESWTVGGSSTSWIYGVRTLEVDNEWMATITAETVASTLLGDLNTIKIKCDFVTKLVPHLDLRDKVTIQYEPKELVGDDATRWDFFQWDVGFWAGENIYDFNSRNFKIMGISHNLDKMESNFTVREI